VLRSVHAIRVVAVALLLAACFGRDPGPPRNLPLPVTSTTVGPGDIFTVQVVGEKDLPTEYRVQTDGTIDFPYIARLSVAGLEPQQITDLLKRRLVEAKVLTAPQVSVVIKQYNSKRVSVIGAVTKPGTVPWAEGMGIVDAISQAGWFTPLGDSSHVLLTRRSAGAKTVTAVVSVEQITNGRQPDIPLQAGDTIKVDQRLF